MSEKKRKIFELEELVSIMAERLSTDDLEAITRWAERRDQPLFFPKKSASSPPNSFILGLPEGEKVEEKSKEWAENKREEETLSARIQEEVRLGL